VENHTVFALEKLGVEFRNVIMAAIFRKCLTLDNSALAKNSSGRIVTLMSNDAQKLQAGPLSIHNVLLFFRPQVVVVFIVRRVKCG
jgi:ATP-binding cassette, subfamily C (CFTR/MRP), member 1